MYSRFFRWATDRLDNNGIIAFITNSSFIHMRTFDGFRKDVSKEFSDIYIIDLGGDIRANPKLSGTTHNVFGIQAGVAISFMVKKSNIKDKVSCKIHYYRRPEFETAEEKIKFLSATNLCNIQFIDSIIKNSEWINIAENNFDDLLPIINKTRCATKTKQTQEN